VLIGVMELLPAQVVGQRLYIHLKILIIQKKQKEYKNE